MIFYLKGFILIAIGLVGLIVSLAMQKSRKIKMQQEEQAISDSLNRKYSSK